MKIILILTTSFLVSYSFSQNPNSSFFTKSDAFFKEFVIGNRVNYDAISENPEKLDALFSEISSTNLSDISNETRKAYLINTYNILVIHQVLEYYPILSPMDISGFFDDKKFNLGNQNLTLNSIENDLLRAEFNDPRLHFVLVCGAKGCPPILNKAYTPDQLETQLETQTNSALNNDQFIYVDNEILFVSEIFKWYKTDFGNTNEAIISFINQYRSEKINTKKMDFYSYDWSLNATELNEVKVDEYILVPKPEKNVNLQTFTAGSLLGHKKIDFTSFSTIYTQTKSNWLGVNYDGVRETFYTELIQVTYGISKNKRFNIGLDINLKASARASNEEVKGILRPLDFQNNDSTRFGLTSLGLRLKASPFKGVNDFSIQSTLYIPTIKTPEGGNFSSGNLYWADWDRYTSWNQFFYVKTFEKFQLFTEADLLFRFRKNKTQITHLDIPISIIGSYFPFDKVTLYGIAQHTSRLTQNINPDIATDWVIPMQYTSIGAGLKYQPKSNVTIELLYTNFIDGRNTGLGNSFNLGVKYITK
jgi:hypothetical protein